MGNPRFVHHASALAAFALLTGCDTGPKVWTRDEIADIAGDAQTVDVSELESRLSDLQSSIDDLETKNRQISSDMDQLRSDHDSLKAEYSDHRHY